MAVPRDPVLRGAVRWLDYLPGTGVQRLRTLFASVSEFSDLTPVQYADALAWLRRTGLVDTSDRPVGKVRVAGSARLAVLEAALEHSAAHWLANADQLVRSPQELPEDALAAAEALGLGAPDAFVALRRVWGKVDTAERERVGSAGELALFELLSAAADGEVRHLAAYADGYGYDIAIDAVNQSAHVEVKATTSRAQLRIFLSRNEYETMLYDPAWVLAAVRLDTDLQLVAVATISRRWVAETAPSDSTAAGRWESVRMMVPSKALTPGLPALAAAIDPIKAPPLVGAPAWPG